MNEEQLWCAKGFLEILFRRPCRKQCLHLHCKGHFWLEKSLVRWLHEFKSWNGRVKAACSRLQDVFQVFVFLICINLYDSWIFCFLNILPLSIKMTSMQYKNRLVETTKVYFWRMNFIRSSCPTSLMISSDSQQFWCTFL